MKNKKLSWILLPAVIAIWGMIGWKVYAALNSESDAASDAVEAPAALLDSTAARDTYQLALNYRDPFFDAPVKPRAPVKSSSHPDGAAKENQKAPKAEVRDTAPVVRYYGLVKETQSGKTVGFVAVDSESHFVKNGDKVSGVEIVRLWSDSVEVLFGKRRMIARKH
jgi:hypothetical protein